MPTATRYSRMTVAQRRAQMARRAAWWAKMTPAERTAKSRDYQRKALYRIDPAEFKRLYKAQGGRCALCRKIPKSVLCVDHDHRTDRVRGLLCNGCNRGLGHLGDTPEGLLRAYRYVMRQKGQPGAMGALALLERK